LLQRRIDDPADADLRDPAFLAQVAASAIKVSLGDGEQKVQNVTVAGKS
jgi:hypothetical protein